MGRYERRAQERRNRAEGLAQRKAIEERKRSAANVRSLLNEAGITHEELLKVCEKIVNTSVQKYVEEVERRNIEQEEYIKSQNLRACESMIALSMIVLHDDFEFGQKRLKRYAENVLGTICMCIDHEDLVVEAYEKTGIKVNIADPTEEIDFTPHKRIKRLRPVIEEDDNVI